MNHPPGTLVSLAMALSLTLAVLFVGYLATLVVPFARSRPGPVGDASRFQWHVLVPCLNEAAVLDDSLTRLRTEFPGMHMWVIDDDSDDATADIIAAHQQGDPLVHLVARQLPQARTGKGDALNAAYRALNDWLPADTPPEQVVVGVFDADGLPGPGCLDVISADHLFGDPEVAAVQIEVRMANRGDRRPVPDGGRARNLAARTLVRMQDIEFRTAIPAMQIGRRITRTVSLGGNGQFARLDALRGISDPERGGPWRGSLLEDYELGLHLKLGGWNTAFTRDTWVDQEALWDVSRLLTQRARWSQGGMQCMRYLGAIWRSPKLTTLGVLEISYSLLQPWFQLFGSLVYPALVVLLALRYAAHPEVVRDFLDADGWELLAAYLVLSLVQFGLWGPLYRRKCEPDAGFWRCLGWGVAYTVYTWLYCLATWRALARLAQGHNSWTKTQRNAEPGAVPPQAAPPPVPARTAAVKETAGSAEPGGTP